MYRLNNSLLTGLQVSIFTNYIEEKEYEGEAILLEKIKDGDTFYLPNELVASNPNMSDKADIERNEKNSYIYTILSKKDNKEISAFLKNIAKLKKGKITDYNNIYEYISALRDSIHAKTILGRVENDNDYRRLFRAVSVDYLTRYLLQVGKNNNHNSIFKYEIWLVKFTSNKHFLPYEARVTRKIRVLVKHNCDDTELSTFVTYNGKISKTIREKKDDEPNLSEN